MTDEATKDIAKLLGARGGNKTKEKYGTSHYSDIVKKRWAKEKAKKKENDSENIAAK
jgi:hypothetical protein